jgi:hypothetical protein
MLHKIGIALIAATLVAAPALAIETQPPAASPTAQPQHVSTSKSKKLAKRAATGKAAGNHRQHPAKTSTTTGAKANPVVAAKRSSQGATALPAKKKSKDARSKITKTKIAKTKIAPSSHGNSNSANSNSAKSKQAKSNHAASSEAASQPAKNTMPANDTGPVPPRSVPTPGLY